VMLRTVGSLLLIRARGDGVADPGRGTLLISSR
jgi:hypothetical protein